jgi:hypothetical protein
MSKVDEIMGLLDKEDIVYTQQDNALLMIWSTKRFDDLKVLIHTSPDEDWVYITAMFKEFSKIPTEAQHKLMYDMLVSSWKVNGVKFVITSDNHIAVHAETNDTDLTAEELRTLIDSTVSACDALADFIPG